MWSRSDVTQEQSPSVLSLCFSCCSQFIMTEMERSVGNPHWILIIYSDNWLLSNNEVMMSCSSPGRLYQTHPSRGQNLLHDPQPGLLQQPFNGHTSTLPPPTSSAPPSNYGNYQNCTIVQSHRPCSSYGTYATLEPKTLIFPIFVQVRA